MELCLQDLVGPFAKFVCTRWKVWTKTHNPNSESPPTTHQSLISCNKEGVEIPSVEEVKVVMERLGICYEADEGDIQKELTAQLFEEEASLEELKGAFDVYDQNQDGFIEAADLHRVFCSLGLKEGFGLEECQRMIKARDTNQDGLIDFHEFVRHMEFSF